jgi:hypothetical protein
MVLYFPAKQFSSRFGDDFFTFTVIGFEEVIDQQQCHLCSYLPSCSTSYVLYVIEMRRGKRSWLIKRRFSEFAHLHRQLQLTSSASDISLPPLPPRTFLPYTDTAFLHKRQTALESYLDVVLRRLSEDAGVDSSCAANFLRLRGEDDEDDGREEGKIGDKGETENQSCWDGNCYWLARDS